MKFDINGLPPTVEDIASEHQRIDANLGRIHRWGWAAIIILGALTIGLWGSWFFWETPDFVLLLSALPAAISAGFSAAIAYKNRVGLVALLLFVLFCSFTIWASITGADSFFASFVSIACMAFMAYQLDEKISHAKAKLRQLTPAPSEACLEIAAWSEQDSAVAAYCAAVVEHRQITQGEVVAMKEWIDAAAARQADSERLIKINEACKKVCGMQPG